MVICKLRSRDFDGVPGQQVLHATAAFNQEPPSVSGLGGQLPGSSADSEVKTLTAVYECESDGAQ